MIFKTKAETLKALDGVLKHGQVLPQFCFTSVMWDIDAKKVLDYFKQIKLGIKNKFDLKSGIEKCY